jgi:hypothetical protein
MNASLVDSRARLRHAVYWLLIVTAAGNMVGRILTVTSADGQTPFLSANDRSRWCTIRSLVDHGTYVIDAVIVQNPRATTFNQKFDKRWYSIDMVRHKGHDSREHYYSTKPTLLPTMLAGEYWLIKRLTGAGLENQTVYVGRLMLIVTNVLPMILYFVLLVRLVERYGTSDWGRIFVMTCATWATFLTTFAVTLNNHLPAAISVLIAVYAALPIWSGGERRWSCFAVAGLSSAFAAANELPALSLFALLAAALCWKSPSRTLLAFAPAAAIVAVPFFLTNYVAHGSWSTPYAHRSDGAVLMTLDGSVQSELDSGVVPEFLRQRIKAEHGIDISNAAVVTNATQDERWVLWDREGHDRLALVSADDGIQVRAWDNWYEYDRSYWSSGRKTGVDLGEPSRAVYAFNLLIGHHGVFSLTPIWLLSIVGCGLMLRTRGHELWALAIMTLLLTVVCLAFYIARPLDDRNYGGVTCGLRWLFWLIPLWLLCMLPVADAMSSRRAVSLAGLILLALSVISACYASLNPWSHPWIFDYWTYLGWITY